MKTKAAVWTTILVVFLVGITYAFLSMGAAAVKLATLQPAPYEETTPVWFPKGASVYTNMYSKELGAKIKGARRVIIPLNANDDDHRQVEQLEDFQKLADGWDVCVVVPSFGSTIYYEAFKKGFQMSALRKFEQRPDTGDLIPKMSLVNTHVAGIDYGDQVPAIRIKWEAARGSMVGPTRIGRAIFMSILGTIMIGAVAIAFYVIVLIRWNPWDNQWPRKWRLRTV